MKPGRWAGLILVALALAAASFAITRLVLRARAERPAAAGTVPPAPAAPGDPAAEHAPAPPPAESLAVTVYYAAAAADGLVGESREIFAAAAPEDWAKQIVADLIAGPTGEAALPALPPSTELRQVFVLSGGVVWVDFSSALRSGLPGGSAAELLAVYAVVNSIALNVPGVQRVGLMIDGRPVDTLGGHVDLRRPLVPDRGLISAPGEAPAPVPAA